MECMLLACVLLQSCPKRTVDLFDIIAAAREDNACQLPLAELINPHVTAGQPSSSRERRCRANTSHCERHRVVLCVFQPGACAMLLVVEMRCPSRPWATPCYPPRAQGAACNIARPTRARQSPQLACMCFPTVPSVAPLMHASRGERRAREGGVHLMRACMALSWSSPPA